MIVASPALVGAKRLVEIVGGLSCEPRIRRIDGRIAVLAVAGGADLFRLGAALLDIGGLGDARMDAGGKRDRGEGESDVGALHLLLVPGHLAP
jgi:hypothetical protein